LKSRVAKWAGNDVEALERTPASPARRAFIAEVIDNQPGEEQAALHMLAQALVAALKRGGTVGLDIGRLEAIEVQLGDITVREGVGARMEEVRAHGTFSTGNITVGGPAKKA
jgi:proline dehydrogenase